VNEILLQAASPFEDLTEFAMAGDTKGMGRALTEIGSELDRVRPVLDAGRRVRFDSVLDRIRGAHKAHTYPEVALGAVDAYRLLVESLHEDALVVPKAVALLDYAGFRLVVLASVTKPDWAAIRVTAKETQATWSSIEALVRNKGLSDAMKTVVGGINQAVGVEDARLLQFAAHVDLDLVDLLESYFEEHAAHP